MKTILRKLIQIPYTFSLMNWAAIVGLYDYTSGFQGFWEGERGAEPQRPNLVVAPHWKRL